MSLLNVRRRMVAGIGLTVLTGAAVCAIGAASTGVGAGALRAVGATLSAPLGTRVVSAAPAGGGGGGGGTSGTSGTSGVVIGIGPQGVVTNKGVTVQISLTVACTGPSFGSFEVT
ncbi:MAG TPA: hypothetical protein VFO60_04790, partial [Candidatus Dormibacteraeota bacterium]|nr:hypothetical protein [Candidatus Dormibacteraeota bacterium]